MKKYAIPYFIVVSLLVSGCVSQYRPNIKATSPEISDNLDLEAVASLFGEVRDLEDFERILNDENEHLSNLDLNKDGFTDYLRVIETVEGTTHLVTIQAALGNDVFQDVATIDVDRDRNNNSYVQVIGNPYFYGNNYIINPIYYGTPFFVNSFWSFNYSPWSSPYYWSYYPVYYRHYRPWSLNKYLRHVNVKRNIKNTYNYTNERRSLGALDLQKKIRRDDYSSKQPNGSFDARNKNTSNKADLNKSRNTQTPKASNRSTNSRINSRNNQNRVNPSMQQPSTSRANRSANPSPSAKSRGSQKSGNTSGSSPKVSRGRN
jgi:hypothetical protein